MKTNNLHETNFLKSTDEGNNEQCQITEDRKVKNFNKLAFLHILRFVLAFSIILWHCPFNIANDYELHPVLFSIRALTMFGGNQAFMLISGMMFYLAYYSKLANGEMKPNHFLKKRAIRIYPVLIVAVLVSYILSLIIHYNYYPEENINLIDLLKDTIFFGSRLFGGLYGIYVGPIWFFAPLCVSYLVSLLIIVITKKKRSIYWFLIPLLITFFSGLGSNFIVPIFSFYTISSECFNFFLGFFFMIFLIKFDKLHNFIKIPLKIICLGIAIIFLYAFYHSKTINPLGSGEMIGSIFCWIPLIICLYGLKFNIIFDNVVFKSIGALSFHMYIWHEVTYKAWIVHFNLQQKPIYENSLRALSIFIILVLTVSVLSFSICELIHKFNVVNKLKAKIYKLNNQ